MNFPSFYSNMKYTYCKSTDDPLSDKNNLGLAWTDEGVAVNNVIMVIDLTLNIPRCQYLEMKVVAPQVQVPLQVVLSREVTMTVMVVLLCTKMCQNGHNWI